MHNSTVIEKAIRARYRKMLSMDPIQTELTQLLAHQISQAFNSGHRVYAFGNGGSAAQAQHFTTELIGRFKGNRKSLPAISLCSDTSALTAIANDFGFDRVFSRQIESLAELGDVVIGFTTSGTSPNIIAGLEEARKQGSTTVLISGNKGGSKLHLADTVIEVGGLDTAIIQEMHLMLIHIICELIESEMGFTEQVSKDFTPRIIQADALSKIPLPPRDSIVWVNGCFDLLHEGHLQLLNIAARSGEFLVVGLNSDRSVKSIKGSDRPFISEMNRARTLIQLPFVDLVVIFSDSNPVEVLRTLKPKIVVKGPEYKDHDFPEKQMLVDMECNIFYTKEVEGLSTSKIINTILSRGNS